MTTISLSVGMVISRECIGDEEGKLHHGVITSITGNMVILHHTGAGDELQLTTDTLMAFLVGRSILRHIIPSSEKIDKMMDCMRSLTESRRGIHTIPTDKVKIHKMIDFMLREHIIDQYEYWVIGISICRGNFRQRHYNLLLDEKLSQLLGLLAYEGMKH